MTTVEIDRDRCEGHGLCEQAAPAVFRLDDEGELEILPFDDSHATKQRVAAAVRSCPVAALQLDA